MPVCSKSYVASGACTLARCHVAAEQQSTLGWMSRLDVTLTRLLLGSPVAKQNKQNNNHQQMQQEELFSDMGWLVPDAARR